MKTFPALALAAAAALAAVCPLHAATVVDDAALADETQGDNWLGYQPWPSAVFFVWAGLLKGGGLDCRQTGNILGTVAAHECGHRFGLMHNTTQGTLMYPELNVWAAADGVIPWTLPKGEQAPRKVARTWVIRID